MKHSSTSPLSRPLVVAALILLGLAPVPVHAAGGALRVSVRDLSGVIPDATVRVVPAGEQAGRRAQTDGAGVAVFDALPSGDYEVRATFAGFADTEEKVSVSEGQTREVELVLSIGQLSTSITVETPNRREQLLLDVAEPTTLIDRAQIEDTGARTAKDLLIEQGGTGIQVNAGGGQGYISINGIPNRGVLVLINGRRYLGRDANGNFNLEDLQLAGVKRIEVVKGAGSALYGSDALGGVVNVITGAPDELGTLNRLSITGGSYSDFRVDDTVTWRGEKGGIVASGGWRTYDGFDLQPDNPQTVGQPGSRWWTGSTTADYQLTPKLIGRFFGDYQDRHIDPYYFSGFTQTGADVYNSIRDLTRYTLAPELELTPTARSSVLLQYNYGRYLRDETRVFRSSGNVQEQAPWREWNKELKLTGRWSWLAGGREQPLQGGYEYRTEKLERGSLDPTADTSRDINVVWVQQEANVGALTLTGGVRYDDYSDFGNEWSPKASALLAITPQHRIRGSYGQGFRPPYFGELYLSTSAFVGNPDLKPEKSETFTAGYTYASSRAQVEADYFFNKVTDGIDFDLSGFPFTYRNRARYNSKGVNLSATVSLPGGFTPSASYTYNKRVAPGEGGAPDVELGGYPKNSGFVKLLWQQPRLGLRANIRGQINGKVPPGAEDPYYQPAYQAWYVQVAKTLATAGGYSVEVFAQVDNVFDERDVYLRQSCSGSDAPPNCQEGAPITDELLQVWIAPRTFQVGVRIGMDWTR